MFQKSEKILVTGGAGFIGFHLIERLLKTLDTPESRNEILNIDNVNDYYDVNLKRARLANLDEIAEQYRNTKYSFIREDIANKGALKKIFASFHPSIVVNLAAQAGVRYSILNPDSYIRSNIIGFYNVLECCKMFPVRHLVYASSSSVYGNSSKVPFSTDDKVDNPVSLYAATKKSDELLAHAYSKIFNIPTTGLRFFTVYGPYGRPDMAYFGFTNKLLEHKVIEIFNYGDCKRDFTYIDDVVEGIILVMQRAPTKKKGEDGLPIPPYRLYNIGKGRPESLLEFVSILQEELVNAGVLPEDFNFDVYKKLVPMQPGDVAVTYADTRDFENEFSFTPKVELRTGLRNFARWYQDYYLNKKI